MKATRTVEERTLKAAERDAQRVQELAERVAELVGKAKAIEDKWAWTNYLGPNAVKLTSDDEYRFSQAIETINRTF